MAPQSQKVQATDLDQRRRHRTVLVLVLQTELAASDVEGVVMTKVRCTGHGFAVDFCDIDIRQIGEPNLQEDTSSLSMARNCCADRLRHSLCRPQW